MKTNKKELAGLVIDQHGELSCMPDIARAKEYDTFGFSKREFAEWQVKKTEDSTKVDGLE